AADFAGVLVDSKAKGYTLDYLGTEDIDGTPAHNLRVTRPHGDVTYVYLDPDTSSRSAPSTGASSTGCPTRPSSTTVTTRRWPGCTSRSRWSRDRKARASASACRSRRRKRTLRPRAGCSSSRPRPQAPRSKARIRRTIHAIGARSALLPGARHHRLRRSRRGRGNRDRLG